MAGTPRFFVMLDRNNEPVRYESGYFEHPLSGPNIVEYMSKEELLVVIDGHLQYAGYTSKTGSAMDMLAELFGEDELSVESAKKLKKAFNLQSTKAKALSDRSIFIEECLIEMSYEVYKETL